MIRRSKLATVAAVAASVLAVVPASPAAADPTWCTGSAVSRGGDTMVVQVNGYYVDPSGYDVILRCYVMQGGREVVGMTDPLVGPVAAAGAAGVIDAAPFDICYDLTVSDMFNAWGYYEHVSNC